MESANIVGYTSLKVPQDMWVMAATPFEGTGTGDGTIDLQNLISGIATVTSPTGAGTTWQKNVPQVQIHNRDAEGRVSSGTTLAFYIGNAKKSQANGGGTTVGWANGSKNHYGLNANAVKLLPGTAYWFKDPKAESTISFAGQVVSTDSKVVKVPADTWQLVCNPFPMDITLNGGNIVMEGITVKSPTGAGTTWQKQCPQIQLKQINADGVVTDGTRLAFYIGNAKRSQAQGGGTTEGWANGSKNHYGLNVNDITIPAGWGFWFKNPNEETVIRFVK